MYVSVITDPYNILHCVFFIGIASWDLDGMSVLWHHETTADYCW